MNKKKFTAKFTACLTALATVVVMSAAPAVSFGASKIEKDETVYVITDSTGAQNDVIVSDHLKNSGKADTISDVSDLTDIENVKGDEKFTQKGNSLQWKAKGNDIFYQGKTDKQVPVTMDVTYYLNGKNISGKDLQGKDGNVKIVINYKNNARVNGTTVPFVVLSGFMIKDNSFTDITIDNGKVVDDGDKQIVVGMAAPGLAKTLGATARDIGFGDSITIEGTAKDFNLGDIMTFVTDSMFEDVDTDEFGKMDYDSQIKQLDEGAKKLVKGSGQLQDGLDQLNGKVPTLVNGVGQLSSGASALSQNTEGTFGKLKADSKALDDGLNQAYDQMVSGNIPGVLTQISGGMEQLKQGIDGGVDQTLEGLGTAKAENEKAKKIVDAGEALAKGASKNAAAADSANDITLGKLEAAKAKIEAKDEAFRTDEEKAVLELIKAAEDSAKTTKEKIVGAETQAGGAEKYSSGASDVLGKLDGGYGKLIEGQETIKGQVDGTVPQLTGGLNQVNAGVAQLQLEMAEKVLPGIGQLNAGIQQAGATEGKSLVTGAKQLAAGMDQLNSSTGTLADGVQQLDQGSKELNNGMSKLYNQGIKKIVDLYNNKLKGVVNDFDNLVNAGKNYNSFTQIEKNTNGSVKFIYKTTVSE